MKSPKKPARLILAGFLGLASDSASGIPKKILIFFLGGGFRACSGRNFIIIQSILGMLQRFLQGFHFFFQTFHMAAEELIAYCMAHGVNYYDTAYIYHGGQSEAFLGRALKKYPRESYFVADKFNVQAEPDFEKQFENQLSRLQLDSIDFYLLHGMTDKLVSDYLDHGAPEYFLKQKKAGKIRYFGFSFHGSPEALRRILSRYPWDFVQIQLNY